MTVGGARLLSGARRVFEAVAVALFAFITAVFAFSIVSRYVFARPVIWADEALVLAMIWCVFLTGALVIEEREQVVFDLLYERCSPAYKRAILIAGSVALAGILAAALPAIVSYTAFLWRERTNVFELRLDYAYSCFAFFIVIVILRRLAMILRLLRADWRSALDEIAPPVAGSAPESKP